MERDGIWMQSVALVQSGHAEAHDAAWEVEVLAYVLIHVNNEGCQNGMHGNWEEYCYCVRQKPGEQ